MRFVKIILFSFSLCLFLFVGATFVHASNKTGFVSENIWYSKEDLVEGDKVKIHTFVFNSEDRPLFGTVLFFDGIKLLGKKDFSLVGETGANVFIDWVVTVGEHNIFGKIENTRFKNADGTFENVYITFNETGKITKKISKKINTEEQKAKVENLVTNITNEITKVSENLTAQVGSVLKNATPVVLQNSASGGLSLFEGVRNSVNNFSENKVADLNEELNVLGVSYENNKAEEKSALEKKEFRDVAKDSGLANVSSALKPFKHAELFFFNTVAFITGNKIIFYLFLILITLFVLRVLYKKIKSKFAY